MNTIVSNALLSAIDRLTKVGALDAFLIALIGVALVFGVLLVLMLFIWLMGFIVQKSPEFAAKHSGLAQFVQKTKCALSFKKRKEQLANDASAATQAQSAPLAKGTCGELTLINTSERDAAMIMAIVADATNTPLNELRFKSIKNISEEGEE